MTSFMDSIYAGKDRFVQDQERKRQETTRRLFGDALQNKPDALTQLYGVDPATALKAKEQNQGDRVKGAQFMHRAATVLKSAPDDQKPIVYSRLIQEAKNNPNVAEFTQGLPDQYDPSIMQHVDGLIGMAGMYEDPPAQGQETWMNGGNGTMISNRGNSKPIEGYVARPVGGAHGGSKLNDLPRKLSDEEIVTYANQMRDAGMPDENIQNFMAAQQSMPDVQMAAINPPPSAKVSPIQSRIESAKQTRKGGIPSVSEKPQTATAAKASKANAVMKAQLPALQRRIERLQAASDGLNSAFGKGKLSPDGGPLDQYALKFSPANSELESAAAQLKPVLMSFVRVPGIGAQSDLEARLDSLQYPDASQPPAVRNKNIQELKLFIKDLTDAMNGADAAPTAPKKPVDADQALLDKYLK